MFRTAAGPLHIPLTKTIGQSTSLAEYLLYSKPKQAPTESHFAKARIDICCCAHEILKVKHVTC